MSSLTDAATKRQGNVEDGVDPATPPIGENLVGTTLDGRYAITRRLGIGGMGAVYEGQDLSTGEFFAIKVLQSSFSGSEKYRKRFLREAKAAGAIHSPHIVRASDFGSTTDGLLYFTMELLDGEDLEQHLKRSGHLRWEQFETLFFQTLEAVQAAHARGVIHRDIKPSNCFLCRADDDSVLVKVLDFGIAKFNATGADGENSIATVDALTATDEIFGTVAYMAPELIEGQPADARSDIYALGVMLFRSLTGSLPFTGANAYKVLQHHVGTPVPSMRERQPDIPAAIESVVFRAMAKRPEHRYQSIEEFEMALAAASRGVLEPSSAALSGRTEAMIVPPSMFAQTEPALGNSPSHSGPIVTHLVQDPGSLQPLASPPSRSSPWLIMSLVLVVSAGTAAIVGAMMRPSSTEAPVITEAPIVIQAEQPVAELSETPSPEIAPSTPETAPTPLAPEGESSKSDSTGEAEPETAEKEEVETRTKVKKARPRPTLTLETRAGERCPDALGESFTIKGIIGSNERYIEPDVRGGSQQARTCIKSFIRRQRFPSAEVMRSKTLELHPR